MNVILESVVCTKLDIYVLIAFLIDWAVDILHCLKRCLSLLANVMGIIHYEIR
jgi:hypothetical protein